MNRVNREEQCREQRNSKTSQEMNSKKIDEYPVQEMQDNVGEMITEGVDFEKGVVDHIREGNHRTVVPNLPLLT